MPLLQAILLDLDDTILADSEGAAGCWQHVCAQYAARAGCAAPEPLATAIAAERAWYWDDRERQRRGRLDLVAARREIVGRALARLRSVDGNRLDDNDGRDEALAEEIAASYAALRVAGVAPFPGAIETVATLRERGLRLALLTNGNGTSQRAKIERHALAPYFDCILVEGEFGAGKPDPRIFRQALGELGTSAARTWMVGDNLEGDIAGAQAVGIAGVWVDVSGVGLPAGSTVRPAYSIRALPEVLRCLELAGV